MRYMPFAMRLYRFYLYAMMEKDFFGFYQESGGQVREDLKRTRIEYLKRTAPEKYHDALTPRTEIGCKRKVEDTGYLECLHRENVELVHSDGIEEITETGVRTQSGREIHADAIILATGFQTQQLLHPMEIIGEQGITLNQHVCWYLASSLFDLRLTTMIVGKLFIRITTGLLWDLRVSVSKLLHSNGSQYDHRPFISDLLH